MSQLLIINEAELPEFNIIELRDTYQNNDAVVIEEDANEETEEVTPLAKNPSKGKGKKRKQNSTVPSKVKKPTAAVSKRDQEPRFSVKVDVDLLTEILTVKPMFGEYKEKADKWKEVKKNMNVAFDVPTLQRRFKDLLAKFREEELECLKSSGTDEEKTERATLLTDINEIMTDITLMPISTIKNDDKKGKEAGEEIRKIAMQTLSDKREKNDFIPSQVSPGGNNKRKSVMEVLHATETEKMAYKREKLDFEMQKFKDDKEERALDRALQQRRLQLQEKAQEDSHELMMALVQAFKK